MKDALPVELIGMNSAMMSEYIKFCADRLLVSLNLEKLYNVSNPFDWMDMISLQGKTNFFEKRVSEYSKSGVGVEAAQQVISFDEDFWWSAPIEQGKCQMHLVLTTSEVLNFRDVICL